MKRARPKKSFTDSPFPFSCHHLRHAKGPGCEQASCSGNEILQTCSQKLPAAGYTFVPFRATPGVRKNRLYGGLNIHSGRKLCRKYLWKGMYMLISKSCCLSRSLLVVFAALGLTCAMNGQAATKSVDLQSLYKKAIASQKSSGQSNQKKSNTKTANKKKTGIKK